MNAIAYLANCFPEAGEPYVWEEICELRKHGRPVIPFSFRRPRRIPTAAAQHARETVYLLPPKLELAFITTWLFSSRIFAIRDLVLRAVRGPEPVWKRLRTVAHTWLGFCLAAVLRRYKISHIHVHHGYFSAWAGMVAARLLGINFSMTLHGSDLLVRADYLDSKLANCRFCVTVSNFNRDYIHAHYPQINSEKIRVHRLGLDLGFWRPLNVTLSGPFRVLSVSRLHPVKNHEFLIRACHTRKQSAIPFKCVIAGEGEERGRLEKLVNELGLANEVELRGHVERENLPQLYAQADVVVISSHSEGIPIAAMEAMAMERVVLAPEITGIPELVQAGRTGFLYVPGSMDDFLAKLELIREQWPALDQMRKSARRQVETNFNRACNLQLFAADFLQCVRQCEEQEVPNANTLLQQI